jgi:hypothetical protein
MKKLIVMFASLSLVAGFVMTAAAADWNFYGSARVQTWWTDTETSGTSVDDFAQSLQGNSRIGAKVKVSGDLSGRFEYGASGGNANIRHLYGEWNFGAGLFLVGQTYSPLYIAYSGQVYDADMGLGGVGDVDTGRAAQLKLTFGDFHIALVALNEDDDIVSTSTEATIPAVEASYSLSFDPVSMVFAGGYQTYETVAGGISYDVDAYVLAVGATANFGMAYFSGNVYFGQNASNLIAVGNTAESKAALNGTALDDSEALGYNLILGAKFNDMFSCELGYGHAESELDSDTTEDNVSSYYLNTTITLAPGVFVVPEIGIVDHEEAGQAEKTYFGAKWQINF